MVTNNNPCVFICLLAYSCRIFSVSCSINLCTIISNFQEYKKNFISVGPWGGQGGHKWDDGVYSTVRQVEVAHGAGIDSIKVQYDSNGTPEWEEKRGGIGGAKVDTVSAIECSGENICSS